MKKTKGKRQRAKGKRQKAKSKRQRAIGKEQKTKGKEQKTKGNRQLAIGKWQKGIKKNLRVSAPLRLRGERLALAPTNDNLRYEVIPGIGDHPTGIR